MIPTFQGDIDKQITGGSSSIRVREGSATRDMGIENAIKYSLFVRDWFANAFIVHGDQTLKSRFEEECSKSLTLAQLLNVESAATESLKWMVSNGSVSKIEVDASITDNSALYVVIQVFPPGGGNKQDFSVSRYAGNWKMQALKPVEG